VTVKAPTGVARELDRVTALDSGLLKDVKERQCERREHDVLAASDCRLAGKIRDLALEAIKSGLDEARNLIVREPPRSRVSA
jgi:hypothetical protein